jgi:hypothetical protein
MYPVCVPALYDNPIPTLVTNLQHDKNCLLFTILFNISQILKLFLQLESLESTQSSPCIQERSRPRQTVERQENAAEAVLLG